MKKIFLIGAAALGMFFMTTSCMDNTEPAGIEEMRMAKSELLRAQAAYETARAAVEQANAAIQQAKAEWQTLQNQLVEITVQEEQLDLELRQAEQEYKIALLEYQYQAEIAADSADIMYYQSKIAWYEWEVMRCEMEQDSISLSRERMIERHNAWLLQLQTATAQAQYNYETALRDIAALKTGLTEKESAKLEGYIKKIEGTNGTDGLRGELRQAETVLIDAQRNLLQLQMSLNADSLFLENVYAAQVDAQNVVLKFAEEALAEAPDLTSSDSWVAQKVAAEEEMENIEKTIGDLQRDAEEMKGEKAPFEAKVQELNKEKEILTTQIKEVYAQLGFEYNHGNPTQSGTALESKLDERAVFTLTIPENILQVVAPIINDHIKATDKTSSPKPADNDVVIISGIEEVDGKYVLENGESFSWETSYKKANEIFDGIDNEEGLIAALDELHLATAEIADVQLKINDATIALNDPVTGYKSQYDKYLAIFDEGLADFNEYAEEYGITYNSEDEFVLNSVNMAQAAKDALADIHELLSGATDPTQAQIEPLINTIRTEQETRFALVGHAVADYEKLTYANYSAATPVITITDLENAVADIDKNPVISSSASSALNYIPEKLEMDTDVSKWSAAARWAIASDKIYGQSYVRQTLTNDYVGYGEAFIVEFKFEKEKAEAGVSIKSLLDDDGNNNNNLKEWLNKLGYINGVDDFTQTLFYHNIAQPILIAGLQSLVSDNTLYANLVQEVETYDLAIDALVKENTGAAAELYAQLRDLYDQLEAKDDAIEVAQKSIDSVVFEISKICSDDLFKVTFGNSTINVPANDYSQVGVEVRKWNILYEKVNRLNSLLNNEPISIIIRGEARYTYNLLNMNCDYWYWDDVNQQYVYNDSYEFTLEELQAVWTESLQKRVEDEQRNLIDLQTNLEMLRASEDPYHYAIQQAEKAVEDAQAAYDNKLAEFNLWNNMLSDLLKILAGNEEELPEENPEA